VTSSIGAAEAFGRMQRGELRVLDVRGTAEYESGHVPGALHVPLGYLPERAAELPRDLPLALYCGGGTRSRIGISVLRRAGFSDLLDQGGGYPAHAEAGLPVE
jgi:hydroxyacylglutathione hydrolase